MNIWEGLILFFAIQSLWVGILILASKKGKKAAKWIWFVFLVLFAYHIFFSVLYWSNLNEELSKRLSLVWMIPLSLYGPLFLHYVKMTVGKLPTKPMELLIHALPLGFVFLIYGKYFALPIEYRDVLFANSEMDQFLVIPPFYFQSLLSLILLVYALFSLHFFHKNNKNNIKEGIWIRHLCVLFIGFAVSWPVYFILDYLEVLTIGQDYIITGFMVIFVLFQSYLVYKRPNVLIDWEKIKDATYTVKYRKAGMSYKVSLEFKEKLLLLMEMEKPYLNPELKLDHLATLMGLSRHHMSQVINQHFNKSFFDFLNEYRIEEAKHILLTKTKEKQIHTIDVIYKVGFNNKTSFYKAFKKYVGNSPSSFLENNLKAV